MGQLIIQWTAQTWNAAAKAPAGTPVETVPRCVLEAQRTALANSNAPYVLPLFDAGDPLWNTARTSALSGGTCTPNRATRGDQVEMLLKAASNAGLTVWLGLAQDETPFYGSGKDSATWMATQTQLAKDVVERLWKKYGSRYRAQIAGFYLPFEPDNVQFGTGTAAYANFRSYALGVATEVHQRAGADKGVMVSPYHVATSPPSQANLQAYQATVTGSSTSRGDRLGSADNVGAGSDPSLVAPWMVAAKLGVENAHAPVSASGYRWALRRRRRPRPRRCPRRSRRHRHTRAEADRSVPATATSPLGLDLRVQKSRQACRGC